MLLNSPSGYGWLLLAGILASLSVWVRLARRDDRLIVVYVAALAGAFVGAKLSYLGAEGWLHWPDPDRWVALATGKSVTGALIGGYAGVELTKRYVGYSQPTGDSFAVIAPLGIALGRVGCILHGCCLGNACESSWFTVPDALGIARWPSALAELLFNVLLLGFLMFLRHRARFSNQLFHIYLMAYGVFRFAHEFIRDTPRIIGPFSGYHFMALAILVLGVVGFVRRQRRIALQPDRPGEKTIPALRR